MATSTITGKINGPDGTALNNVRVTCVLRPRPAFKTSTGAELSPIISTTTSGTGDYSFTLERTADITPDDSYYEIIEYLPDRYGGPIKHTIQVGSSNTTVLASLVSTPPSPIPATYLNQEAADARYVQSPGSFGGAGVISSIEPDDSASAGSESTYARSDHQHAIVAAAPATLTETATPSEGVATSFARSDHVHGTEALPWGELGYAQVTDGSASFTTLTDLTGLSVTVTVGSNRRIKITGFIPRVQNTTTANIAAIISIREGTTTLQTAHVFEGPTTGSGGGQHCRIEHTLEPSSGSHTYKLSGVRDSGTDTHVLGDSATSPAWILVEDIGPA